MSSPTQNRAAAARWSSLLFVLFLLSAPLLGSGTPELQPPGADPVLLLVGDENFGNFGAIDGPATSRLNFRIAQAGEIVYFGLSRAYTSRGIPESTGRYEYQVRSAATGEIVFGPFEIDDDEENLSTYEQAVAGPQPLNPDGYPVDDRFVFVAPTEGVYYVEFSQRNNRKRYIGLWDITVSRDGQEKPGRVYSQNWAFRVPETEPELPECAFGAELNAQFYSYTDDGFVTQIDFTDSGFQPLSFNLAFNRTGPGNTGDLVLDRQSVPEQNLTATSAEHLIFLEEPDAELFPDGTCGSASVTGQLVCQANETFCIPVSVNVAGQVELVLDFNGNGRYDEDVDRLLIHSFVQGRAYDACVPWDGLRADGSTPGEGSTVDILIEYTQGVQHWALYDGEYMKQGFCVNPVRPLCGDGGPALLYYDDINITDDPGNGAPKRVLDGCVCRTDNCRTWTNFNADFTEDCMLDNSATTGYGDRNTLNTWWFAASSSTASFDVPIDLAIIDGPLDHCPGAAVELTLNYADYNEIDSIRWTGPAGPLPGLDDQDDVRVAETGTYTAVVTDEFGCESVADFELFDVTCALAVTVDALSCDDNGTDTDGSDDVFFATLTISGGNSAGWQESATATSGSYGSTITVGPFPITDGPVALTFRDDFYDCCEETVVLTPPPPCSNGCAITEARVLSRTCDNRGTEEDPSDDTFVFTMQLEGVNLGAGWMNDRGQTGAYGVETPFGAFPIADGNQVFRFWDLADTTCFFTAIVQPPNTCSDVCVMEVTTGNVNCQDGGTPFDPSDDTFTFDWTVSGQNVAAPVYSLNGEGLYGYGQTYSSDPVPIANASTALTITNIADANCSTTFTVADVPAGCSDACGITIAETRIVCESVEGSTNPGDDRFVVEILVTNPSTVSQSWRTDDGITGDYGVFVAVGTLLPNSGSHTIRVAETGNAACGATATVTAPTATISCTDDLSQRSYPFSRQDVAGELAPGAALLPGPAEVCWMADEEFGPEARIGDRLSLQRTDTASSVPALFSCYLFGEPGAHLRGAVFSLAAEEALDCCALSNDGPVTALPTNAASVPELPEAQWPEGLLPQQRFSIALRPDEAYTLLTSSRLTGVSGSYRWVILSADGIALDVSKLDAPDPVSSFGTATLTFDLLSHQIDDFRNVLTSTEEAGAPQVTIDCVSPQLSLRDEVTGGCTPVLNRRFDVSLGDTMLTDICAQQIAFRELGRADIVWPAHAIRFGCGDSYPVLDSGYPAPAFTGYPYVYRGGSAVALRPDGVDQLAVTFADSEAVGTDGSQEIYRDWTITDECRGAVATYRQTFKVQTGGVPFFVCPLSNHFCPIVEEDIMLWTTTPWNCRTTVEIPAPEIEDLCDSLNWTFLTEVFRLTATGDTVLVRTLTAADDRLLEDVPPGDYLIRYSGNHATLEVEARFCRFRVVDTVDPIAACRSTLEVSLPANGVIALPVQVFDLGSYDNCGIEQYRLRRQLTADSLVFGDYAARLLFDCADVGNNLSVELWLTDSSGNTNYCTTQLTVLDNTDPYCTGPTELTVSCDELPDGFSAYDTTQLRLLFGMPEVIDNCSAEALALDPIVVGDPCSPDRIRRRFRALDQNGNLSTGLFVQDVFITPALRYAIAFPRDAATDCTDLADTVRLVGTGCDSITVSFTDNVTTGPDGSCRRLERTFTVTNWCEWNGVSAPIQVGRDEDCDGTEGTNDVWVVRTPEAVFVDADSLANNTFPAAGERGSDCDDPNPAGYWRTVTDTPGGRYRYTQLIDIYDTVGPAVTLLMTDSLCADTSECRAVAEVGIRLFDACQLTPSEITVDVDFNNNGVIEGNHGEAGLVTGSYPDFTFTAGFPIGTHRLIVTAADDCGNTTVHEELLTVHDCYVPALTPNQFRRYDLVQLLEEGDVDNDGVIEEAAVEVFAVDLAYCEFTDCSGELRYSVNRVGAAYDSTQTSLFLDCEDRYQVDLEVYVRDQYFHPDVVQPNGSVGGPNWRRAVVRLLLQDPTLACDNCRIGNDITINGRVRRLDGVPVADVAISGTGGAGATRSSRFGGYQLGGEIGGSYAIRASKETDPRDGLSTLDVLILRRHLLGVAEITDPFLLLAADLNRDGAVDVLDVLQLQGLVLARPEFYPAGAPWRFVDANWDGSGLVPEVIYLADAADCSYAHDFVGLRMGDLNLSYVPAEAAVTGEVAGAVLPIEAGKLRPRGLQLPNLSVVAGTEVELPLSLADIDQLRGGQFGLEWAPDALELVGVESDLLSVDANLRRAAGLLWVSWSESVKHGDLLVLRFRARTSGELVDLLQLTPDERYAAEVYDPALERGALFLDWTAADRPDRPQPDLPVVDAEVGYLGVLPNPARTTARLGVVSPVAQTATLTVADGTGRVVLRTAVVLVQGEQWVPVSVADWPAGVYSVVVELRDRVLVGRVVRG